MNALLLSLFFFYWAFKHMKEERTLARFQLICTSTVDLTEEHLRSRDIEPVLFHFHMDEEDYDDDFGKSISFEDFYKRIAQGAMPSTSQPNVQEHINHFEPHLKEGRDVLFVGLSSGISGGFSAAVIAADQLREAYPEAEIRVVDSLGASSGYGLLVDALADLRDQGASLEEAYSWAEENKLKLHHWFFTTDLTHLKRGGRISATSEAIGSILGICPLMNVDDQGKLMPRRKVRGKKKVIKETLQEMIKHAEGGKDYNGKCYISHSASYDDVRALADLIEETFPNLDGKVLINSIGTVIGSHTGPGTVALFFFGDKRVD